LGETVRGWLLRHPDREVVCSLNSEEHYVALAFEQFWQLAIAQQLPVSTVSAASYYVCLCLNALILETLRTSSRPKEVPLSQPAFPGEPPMKDTASSAQIWERLQRVLLNEREQRLAYLLFHCGLRPGEIVRCCSQEFGDVIEISRLRCTIVERFLLNEDHLRWRSASKVQVESRRQE
jgi:non-ribosomal peptide synthetase component F